MQPRRSDQEFVKRHEDREALAKKVATTFTRNTSSAKMLGTEQTSMKREASSDKKLTPQEETLSRTAARLAANHFKDAGLHTVAFAPHEVNVTESVQGLKFRLIQSASIKLAATTPIGDGKRIAQKPFFVNLTWAGSKFSVDSLEKNDQLFPVNKASLLRVAAMDEEATQPAPENEEHDKEDANDDVKRNAQVGTQKCPQCNSQMTGGTCSCGYRAAEKEDDDKKEKDDAKQEE